MKSAINIFLGIWEQVSQYSCVKFVYILCSSFQRVVNRADLLKQAEKVVDEFGNSKALLEIQYENEV